MTLISKAHARWHASLARQWVARLTAQTWTKGQQHSSALNHRPSDFVNHKHILILSTTLKHNEMDPWSSSVLDVCRLQIKISIWFSHLEGFYITSISYRFVMPNSTHAPALTSPCLFLIVIYMISSCNTYLFLPHESIWFTNVYFNNMKNNRYKF